jgi:amino acid adenylation domain-containing protein/non-ribosomal peptide synthase protein (TIGR01720 family)
MKMPTPNKKLDTVLIAKRLAALSPQKRALLEQTLSEQGIDCRSLPIVSSDSGVDQPAVLSFAQQRLWLLHCLDPENPNYNLFGAVRLTGNLDVAVLKKVIETLVDRHQVLRTHFSGDSENVVQVVGSSCVIPLPVEDLTQAPNSEALIQVQAEQFMLVPFDLTSGPLFRLKLLQLSDNQYVLLMAFHHIVADAWSLSVMIKEISILYKDYKKGQKSSLSALPIQYKDYALWQRQWLQGSVYEEQLEYWRTQLKDVPTQLNLPIDFPRPEKSGLNGKVISLPLSQELSGTILKKCQANSITPYMLLLAIFQVLLHRLSGQQHICVGSSIATRPRPETENLIGFFVNTLVMHTDFSANPTVEKLLSQVRTHVLDAISYQDLPFDKLVEELRPERLQSQHPFFQVLFVMQNAPVSSLQLPEISLETINSERRFARFDLSLRVSEANATAGFELSLEYNADLFKAETAHRLLKGYVTLCDAIVSASKRRISELQIWTDSTFQASLANQKQAVTPTMWLDKITEQTQRHPKTVALRENTLTLSYQQLKRQSDQLAIMLIDKGVAIESAVGIYADRGIVAVTAMLAIAKAGGFFVPLDPDWPQARSHQVIADANIRWVVCDTNERIKVLENSVEILHCTAESLAVPNDKYPKLPSIHPQQLAYVIYTSGSTGEPKGVAISHQSLSHYIENILTRLDLNEESSFGWFSGISADLGYTSVWGALCSGRSLQVFNQDQAYNAESWSQLMANTPVSVIKIAPSHLKALWAQTGNPISLLPTTTLILGGESLDAELVTRLHSIKPALKLLNHYGPTETTIGVSSAQVNPLSDGYPIGMPFDGVDSYVMDAYAQSLPDGLAGELFLGGASLARGYLGKPAQTAEYFVPHPYRTGERLYRSGDRVRKQQNGLHFIGRVDGQISLHGYRIEPAEVEMALRHMPGIADVAVIIENNQGKKQLIAYLLAENNAEIAPQTMRAQATELLPTYMVPAQWRVVKAFPLSATGKIDKHLLTKLEPIQFASKADESVQSDIEQQLTLIWQDVLKLETIGRHDEFFALGGDSILGLQVVARAKRAGLSLTPKLLFDTPTLAALGAVLENAKKLKTTANPVSEQLAIPLTPIQHWFFEQQLVNRAHWNQSLLLAVNQPLSIDKLREAVTKLIAHHDSLRLSFQQTSQGWQQCYQPLNSIDVANCVHYIDLNSISDGDERSRLIETQCASLQNSFKLNQPPLFCMAYFDLGEHEAGRLFIVAHHLLVDGVSWRILLDDIASLYENESLGSKTSSYQSWAKALQDHASGTELSEQRTTWNALPSVKPLPRDHEGINTQSSSASISLSLTENETAQLLALTNTVLDFRIDEVLLTALSTALCQWTAQAGIIIECEGHGRELASNPIDVSRTVGWFTSRYPIYIASSSADEIKHLRAVKAQLRDIRGIEYGLLRYLSPPSKALGEQIDAEISYNYLGQIDKGMQSTLWSKASESAGHQRDPQSLRPRILVVNAQISNDCLTLNWLYSEQIHQQKTIARIAEQSMTKIRTLLQACHEVQTYQATLDFETDVALDADEVSQLMQEIGNDL